MAVPRAAIFVLAAAKGGAVAVLTALANPPSAVLLTIVLAAAIVPALADVLISYRLSRH